MRIALVFSQNEHKVFSENLKANIYPEMNTNRTLVK